MPELDGARFRSALIAAAAGAVCALTLSTAVPAFAAVPDPSPRPSTSASEEPRAPSDGDDDASTGDGAAGDAGGAGEAGPAAPTQEPAPEDAPADGSGDAVTPSRQAPPAPAATDAPTDPTPTPTGPSASPATPSTVTPQRGAVSRIAMAAAADAPEPTTVWVEDFEAVSGAGAVRLDAYGSGGYTADAYWLAVAQCNGVLATYATTDLSICSASGAGSRNNVRRLADVLGQVGAGVTASSKSTQGNRALAEWTESTAGAAGQTLMLQRSTALPISATERRYYALGADLAEASCTVGTRAQVTLGLAAGTTTATSRVISPCTDAASGSYSSPELTGGWGNGGAAVRAGRFVSDAGLALSPAQLRTVRPAIRNLNVSSNGNDLAIDNLRLLDVTPQLDVAAPSGLLESGAAFPLTFTVSNTSEGASKTDWGFTTSLPAGMTVAEGSQPFGGTCVAKAGAALSRTTNQDRTSVTIAGGDLAAGDASCTVTVQVVAAAAGMYQLASPRTTPDGVVAPEAVSFEVQQPTTVTVRKNVTARAASADQFQLTLSRAGSVVAETVTTGTANGIQRQQIGPVAVVRGATYTIAESVRTTAALSTYTSSYECARGSTTIARGTAVSGEISIPDEAGVDIVCTFTNAPQTARFYCDASYLYAIGDNGVVAQVDAAARTVVGVSSAPAGVTSGMNALALAPGGETAWAVQRSSNGSAVTAVVKYSAAASGALVPSRDTAAAQTLGGAVVGGAVNPLTGRFVVLTSLAGQAALWEYNPDAASSRRFTQKGYVDSGFTQAANGDLAFDSRGNLHILQSVGGSSKTIDVTRADYDAAGGTSRIASTATPALAPGVSDVNGIGFTARGTVFLASGASARQYDALTLASIGDAIPFGSVFGANQTATDLATCASPSTISVEKNIVQRRAGGTSDQFTISLTPPGASTSIASATTTGATTGVQSSRIAPTAVQIGTTVTIGESAASGSLSSYTTVYECWADGLRFAQGQLTGAVRSTPVTVPEKLGVGVACTLYNTPVPTATVTVRKLVVDATGANPVKTAGWTMGTRITSSTGTAVLPVDPAGGGGQVSQANTVGDDGAATFTVLFGTAASTANIAVSETQQNGYRVEQVSCTVKRSGGTTTTSLPVGTSANVPGSITSGDVVDCTFTNRPIATLVLKAVVSSGSQSPGAWSLRGTAQTPGALAGPTGAGSTAGVSATVSPGVAYRLTESGGPATYVRTGAWSCVDGDGQPVTVSAGGDVSLSRGSTITCTIAYATSSVTLLKTVQNPRTGFQPSTWNLTATPASLPGLQPVTVAGADYAPRGGNAASAFEARPGHSYTLSEAVAKTGTRLAYKQVRLERLDSDGTWTQVADPVITAPGPGSSAVYRFVNAPVEPIPLPLTGGPSADAYLIAGGALLVLALLAGGALHHRRRREGPN